MTTSSRAAIAESLREEAQAAEYDRGYDAGVRAEQARTQQLRTAVKRAIAMLPANAACGILRAAISGNQNGRGR